MTNKDYAKRRRKLLYVGLTHPDLFLPGVLDPLGLLALYLLLADKTDDLGFVGIMLLLGFFLLNRFIEHRDLHRDASRVVLVYLQSGCQHHSFFPIFPSHRT